MNFMSSRSQELYDQQSHNLRISLSSSYNITDQGTTTDQLMRSDSSYSHHYEYVGDVVGGGASTSTGGTGTATPQIEKEHMFDKVVTPSDVGKLNRLVIPKQYAEKYFPLDSSTYEKGLLLNFEDRNGKPWRFRYSYWNSSQSYVMTKGWSRFVKEKRLDAGDIVSFNRGIFGKDRLFIDWRHRSHAPPPVPNNTLSLSHHLHQRASVPYPSWNHPLFLQPRQALSQMHLSHPTPRYNNVKPYYNMCFNNSTTAAAAATNVVNGNPCSSASIFHHHHLRSGNASHVTVPQLREGVMQMHTPIVLKSVPVPVVQVKAAAAKQFRLFGVNMECPISDMDDDEYDMFSSTSNNLPNSTVPHYSLSTSINNYDDTPLQLQTVLTEESSDKGKASMSLDLDI